MDRRGLLKLGATLWRGRYYLVALTNLWRSQPVLKESGLACVITDAAILCQPA